MKENVKQITFLRNGGIHPIVITNYHPHNFLMYKVWPSTNVVVTKAQNQWPSWHSDEDEKWMNYSWLIRCNVIRDWDLVL